MQQHDASQRELCRAHLCNDCLVLNGVEGAGRVHQAPTHLYAHTKSISRAQLYMSKDMQQRKPRGIPANILGLHDVFKGVDQAQDVTTAHATQ